MDIRELVKNEKELEKDIEKISQQKRDALNKNYNTCIFTSTKNGSQPIYYYIKYDSEIHKQIINILDNHLNAQQEKLSNVQSKLKKAGDIID